MNVKALHKYLLPLAFGVYGLVFADIALQAVFHPKFNWDILGYMGAIIAYGTNDAAEIYEKTIAATKGVFKPETNHFLFDTPAHFAQQLPFYKLKPLYLGAVWLVGALGAGIAKATWYVSALSFALLGGVLALWKPAHAPRALWLMAVALLCLVGKAGMKHLANFSTPDAFCLLWTMVSFMAWSLKRSYAGFAVASLLAVLSRPDAAILALALTGYFTLFADKEQRMQPLHAGLTGFCIIALYFINNIQAGAYSWGTMFYYNFINRTPDIGALDMRMTFGAWFQVIKNGLARGGLQLLHVPFFAGLSLAAAVAGLKKKETHHWLWLLGILWGAMVARYLLFPSHEDRFYYPYYLLMLMACLELACGAGGKPKTSSG